MKSIIKYLPLIFISGIVACSEKSGNDTSQTVERPAVDETIWTSKSELFVEFPALTVNEESRFAAHFTKMSDHSAVTSGQVVTILEGNGQRISSEKEKPSSPGIFRPTLTPKKAGTYKLLFVLNSPELSDTIVVEKVKVYPSVEASINELGQDEGEDGSITFLKEQAWKMTFKTVPAVKAPIYETVAGSGVWRSAPGASKSVVSPVTGIVNFGSEKLTEGSRVRKGQVLFQISGGNLVESGIASKLKSAKATYKQAKQEFERKKDLQKDGIISKADFEIAEKNFRVAEASFKAMKKGVSGNSKQVRAPFDGYIKRISVQNGDYVGEGQTAIVLGSEKSRILETYLSPSSGLSASDIRDIWFKTPQNGWQSVKDNNGEVLSVSEKVDPTKPMVSVFAKTETPSSAPEGAFTETLLAYGPAHEAIAIPESALLEDYGQYSVIVQLSGESFERRNVVIGRKNGKMAEVLKGLSQGEVVVTKGAYQVRMASMSGQAPAHGHEH
ncbi:hypothetical protein FUAX_20920 [Fulvitalea axinellae]|uniref:Efflux RND transporter periplasmic adaptor subunit n=1 Tax=Fulvitalea axinellae TaxID=1182444 RepID=A0AAU9DBD6_9BACT|nr:hypothetical protein FUAX_20920 [Fulvitalea axinellae]